MSGLANYASASYNLSEELLASLTEEEVMTLHKALTGHRVMDWMRWRNTNEALVADFVASTPSARIKKKKFEEFRLYLTMAGVQYCLEAHALLTVITNSWLVPGGSYRRMAADAGKAYNQLFEIDVPYWPFSYMESPFIDDPSLSHE